MTTDELLRKKFDELRAKKAEIEVQLNVHRNARDAIVAKIRPLEGQAKEHADAVRSIIAESGLFELDNEIAQLARALNPRVEALKR